MGGFWRGGFFFCLWWLEERTTVRSPSSFSQIHGYFVEQRTERNGSEARAARAASRPRRGRRRGHASPVPHHVGDSRLLGHRGRRRREGRPTGGERTP